METTANFARDRACIVDISGPATGNKPKAHVIIRYFEQYLDGSTRDIQVLSFDKPILNVFMHAGYTNLLMNFNYRGDQDLRMAWRLYMEYSKPENSVSYTPEEMESGFYMDGDRKKKVYFPMLEVILSPIGKESEYEIHGTNPAFVSLGPKDLHDQEICVMQFTFDSSWFHVIKDLEPVDMNRLRREAQDELVEETGQPI